MLGRFMKRVVQISGLVSLWAFSTGLSPLLAQALAPPPGTETPHAKFSEITHDFGKVKAGEMLRHDFVVTNTGTGVLEITAVQPGCGCTTAGTWDRQVQPGQIGKIPIQFNPGNFSGTVQKPVTITCNDPAQGTHVLQVRATIWRPIDVQPLYAHFTLVEGEATNDTKVVRITSNLDEPLTLQPPESTSTAFKTELKTIQPGKEFELHISYASEATNSARAQGNITIKTSATNMPVISVTTYAMVQPVLMAMPQSVQLPAAPWKTEYKHSVMIRNSGSAAVQITEPQVTAEGVGVKMIEAQPGKVFSVNLSFPQDFQIPAGKTVELTLKTSHPKNPVLRIPIRQLAAPVVAPAPALPPPRADGASGK